MDSVELEQQYGSKKELNQPSLPPLKRESRSMHHSIDGRRMFGGEHALNTCTLYSDFMHSYTISLQAMNPRRSVISFQSHGKYGATTIVVLGHSLGGQREACFMMGDFLNHQTYLTHSTTVRWHGLQVSGGKTTYHILG